MDPNSQNLQGDSEAVKKLENDLNTLTKETKSVESQSTVPITIPEEQPTVSTPVVEEPPKVPTSPEDVNPQPVSTTNPPTLTADQTEPKKKESPLIVVAIVLVVLAVLAVVIYMFGSKVTQVQPTPVPVVTIIPTVTPIETPIAFESASPLATANLEATTSATSSPSATIIP